MDLSRRHVLKLGGIALAATAVRPSHARGQTPKRGGTLALRTWDPPHFDPFQTISYKTHIALSFTHSRLLKHKAGPNVVPGTFAIEGDLAESWSQPNETTYVFKLRKGVRWHNKPPVNGRELTADDVVYSVNHFLTVKGNANAYMRRSLEKGEAVDRHAVKYTLKQKRPNLKTVEFPSAVMSHISMRTDAKPFSDVRVRQAMSLAIDRQAIIDAVFEGVGVINPPVPAALREWSVPMDKLGEGAKYYAYDPAEAKRLLAAAGYPNGFPASMCFTTYGSTILVDSMQLVQKSLKDVGIDVRLDTKEYGAYISTCFYGKFDSMTYGPQTGFLEPDNFLFGQYYPEELKNQSHINDPVVSDMLGRQRRTVDLAKRREVIFDIQRHLAKQQYYVQMPSGVYIGVWEGALKNYAPSFGYDYGGRLMAAWLDR